MITGICRGYCPLDDDDARQLCMIGFRYVVLPRWAAERFRGALPKLACAVFKNICRQHVFATYRHGIQPDKPAPSPLDILIQREDADRQQLRLLRQATTPIRRRCVELTIAGWAPSEIEAQLKLNSGRAKSELWQFRKSLGHLKPTAITQYTLRGKRLAVFASARAAGRATGIPGENISAAVRGTLRQAGGYVWRTTSQP